MTDRCVWGIPRSIWWLETDVHCLAGPNGTPPTHWSDETIPNPYDPPRVPPSKLDFTRKGITLLPADLANRTKRAVRAFGLFQFAWPLCVSFLTDSLHIDLIAMFIAANGSRIRRASFKRFPWTALLCCIYPAAFVASLVHYDALDLRNWIPSRFSPVLGLQLVSAVWAVYAIALILRCYFHHQRQEGEE